MLKRNSIRRTITKAFAGAMTAALLLGVPVQTVRADEDYTYTNRNGTGTTATSKTWTQISNDTWILTDSNGNTEITLVSSTDADGNTVWTYTFNVEDADQAYKVYEEMTNNGSNPVKSGYSTAGSSDIEVEPSEALDDNGSLKDGYTSKTEGNITKYYRASEAIPQEYGEIDSTTHSYTITNSKSHTTSTEQTGSLRITKSVDGTMPNESQSFAFTVTLSGSTTALQNKISGAKLFGNVPFMDGVGTISLTNGGTAEITGIPAGLTYTITEADVTGYSVKSSTNAAGTIAVDTDPETWTDAETSAWVNESSYTSTPQTSDTVSFTVKKEVSGVPDIDDAEYGFLVHLEGLIPTAEYIYGNNNTYTADSEGTADVAITLAKDGSVAFPDIPVGASYQVVEDGGDHYTAAYTVTDASAKDKIAQSDGAAEAGTSLSTAKETADAGEDVTITFTNTYKPVQNLTLKKYMGWNNEGKAETYSDADKSYEFTIEFSGMEEGTSFLSDSAGRVTADEDGEAMKTVQLPADGTEVNFYGIPAGVEYRITETGSDDTPSYAITSVDTYGNSVTGTYEKQSDAGNINEDLSTAIETVDANESDTVTFMNTPSFDLTLAKDIRGNMASRDEYFKFTLELGNLEAGKEYAVDITDADGTTGVNGVNTESHTNPDKVTAGTDGTVTQVFYLQGGQSVVVKNLPYGTSYGISEDKDAADDEGYTVSAEITGDEKNGGSTAEENIMLDSSSYKVSDSALTDDTAVTFTNTKGAVIPTKVVVGSLWMVGAIAAAVLVMLRKTTEKSKEES